MADNSAASRAPVTTAANRRPTARKPNVSLIPDSYAALDGSQQLYGGGQDAPTNSYAAFGGSHQVGGYAMQDVSTDSYAVLDGSQQLYTGGHDAGGHDAGEAGADEVEFGFGKPISGLNDDVPINLPAEYDVPAIGESSTNAEPQQKGRRVSQLVNKIEMINLAQPPTSGAHGAPPLPPKLSQGAANPSNRNARSSHNVAVAVLAMEQGEAARNGPVGQVVGAAVSMRQQLQQQHLSADSSAA